MTYRIVELLADGLPNGFGVVIYEKHRKPRMLMNGDNPQFLLESDAKTAGERFIKKFN